MDLERVGLFADGVAVKRIGDETFRVCQAYLDDVITVDSDEICAAVKDIFENVRAIAEPSGALSLAGLKKYVKQHNIQGETLVNVLSGANLNFHSLRYVSERCEIGEKHEALLAVTIPEQKGSFLKFCHLLGDRAVTEFNYRYSDSGNTEQKKACIFVGVRVNGGESEKQEIISQLQVSGYDVQDLSDDDIAKTHIRYMIGGRNISPQQTDSQQMGSQRERLYSFVFPEQKGALVKFLQTLGTQWNISLFHYRNHGADYGDILCAFQISETTEQVFHHHLQELGYAYQDVTDSASYRYFLK